MIVLKIHRANPAPALPTNKNAPYCCEAFGAENEIGILAGVIFNYYL